MEEVKQEESKKCKGHKVFIIVIILIAMSISFGCGFLFSEKLKDLLKILYSASHLFSDTF